MLIALEGSSPTIAGENNYKYYVWEAYRDSKQRGKIYLEGPAALALPVNGKLIAAGLLVQGNTLGAAAAGLVIGTNIREIANKAGAFISAHSGPVFLIGWSRGAAACIQVAHNLARGGRKVEAMFLFDAVDQDLSTSSDLNFIPASVQNVYHAIAVRKSWSDKLIFPTCGKVAAPGVNFVPKNFNTSHGGIAGADPKLGDDGSKEWMWGHLRNHGVL
jgi:pimeloyl-ACP methyl ester carboxylesterase